VTATGKVDIRDAGSVDDISAPRVAIADSAHFRGSIDIQRPGGPKPGDKPAATDRPAETSRVPVGATSAPQTPPVR
jgi:hypothetical protein